MYGLKRMIERIRAIAGRKKPLVLLASLAIVLAGATGGTLAWVASQTPAAVNTFTTGDIAITLTETDTEIDDDQSPDTNRYLLVPGKAIAKDPHVTVLAESEDCWLYVLLDASESFDQFLEYVPADGWLALPGVPHVIYRAVDRAEAAQVFPVLKDDLVQVKPSVTLQALASLSEGHFPVLSMTAFAVQRSGVSPINTPEGAWQLLQDQLPVH